MKASLYTIGDDGAEQLLATYEVVDGVAVGSWPEKTPLHYFRDQIEQDGVFGPGGVLRFPKDGKKFVEALETNFANSSRITARVS